MDSVIITDNFLPNPKGYLKDALSLEYKTFTFPGCMFHGIAVMSLDSYVPEVLRKRTPQYPPVLSFIRKSPKGQVEPHFIHTDVDMGEWSALLYLNPEHPRADGTAFWKHIPTGEIENSVPHLRSQEGRQINDKWEIWKSVPAKFNRLVTFPSTYYHSRTIFDNYGSGNDARLVQVTFGGKHL
jgi:hypothetical protein